MSMTNPAPAPAVAPSEPAPTTGPEGGAPAPIPGPPPASTAQTGATQGADNNPSETPEQMVARLRADVERLEREKADVRIQKEGELKREAKRQELLNVAKVAGIEVEDPSKETIETLTQKLTGKVMKGDETTSELQQAKIELAVYRTSALPDVRVDPDKLTNRVSFVKAVAALDPSAADFNDQVKSAIMAEIQNDPTLRVSGGTSKSGADQYGGAGGGQITKEAFAQMGVGERTKLFQTDPALYERLANG